MDTAQKVDDLAGLILEARGHPTVKRLESACYDGNGKLFDPKTGLPIPDPPAHGASLFTEKVMAAADPAKANGLFWELPYNTRRAYDLEAKRRKFEYTSLVAMAKEKKTEAKKERDLKEKADTAARKVYADQAKADSGKSDEDRAEAYRARQLEADNALYGHVEREAARKMCNSLEEAMAYTKECRDRDEAAKTNPLSLCNCSVEWCCQCYRQIHVLHPRNHYDGCVAGFLHERIGAFCPYKHSCERFVCVGDDACVCPCDADVPD